MTTPSAQSRSTIEADERTESSQTRTAAYFVNDRPVDIRERRPTVRAIIQAAGYEPEKYDVFRLSQKDDPTGQPIELDERIQATPQHPVYLRCEEKDGKKAAVGVAPGLVTTPTADATRPLGITDIEGMQPTRPRDQAQDVPPGPRP